MENGERGYSGAPALRSPVSGLRSPFSVLRSPFFLPHLRYLSRMALLSSRRIFTGRVVSLDVDTVQFPNGNTGNIEMLRHPGAAAVVPFLDDPAAADPRVLLIRQFRHATSGYLWEIPAGLRNGDETPAAAARRELREETGYLCDHLEPLTTFWTTPGFTNERIDLFLATGLVPGDSAREDDEVIELHEVRWSEALRMVRAGEIDDAKSVIAILYAEMWKRS
jgi:ADP-ribose pyrophosphatase